MEYWIVLEMTVSGCKSSSTCTVVMYMDYPFQVLREVDVLTIL